MVAPKFLEILIKDASVNVDIKSENADLPTSNQDTKCKSFEFKLKGMENSTRISVNTSALGNKIQAFQLILKLAEAMSFGFAPYIETVLPLLKTHINHFSKAIRKASLKTYRFILSDIHEPENLKFFRQIYNIFGLNIVMANKKDNVKELKLLFKEMFHCMRIISENQTENRIFESEQQMNSFIELMGQCLNTVAVNKEHQLALIEEKNQNHQIDAEDEDQIKEELYKITGAATYINECADVIFSVYGKECRNMIEIHVQPYFAKVLNEFRVVSERELQDCTFFFMQFVNQVNNEDPLQIMQLCQQFVEILLWSKPEMADVRQNAIYGIAVFAKNLNQNAFTSLLPNVMKAIETCLTNPEALSDENLAVTENAVVCLGYVSLLHSKDPAHVTKFCSALPLKGEDEAKEAHGFLLKQVVGGNFCNSQDAMKQAVKSIATAVQTDATLLDETDAALLTQALSL